MAVEEKVVQETKKEEINRIFQAQLANEITYANQPIEKRYERLDKLHKAIVANRQNIRDAVYKDFRKPEVEVDATEILTVIAELKFAKRNLVKWTRPQTVSTPISMLGSKSQIIYEAKGASLILSPWNFPIMLTLAPLISAIAAGCPVILKPSEHTPHSSNVLQKIINETFEENAVALLQGGIKTSSDLLALPFKHIYFTGAPSIGKVVMKAAAKNLSSITLELGGKSPVIIDKSANLKKAAKRVAWSKFINCGQTCIAPDYILVHSSVKDELVKLLKENVRKLFSDQPSKSDSYARIINNKHFDRVNGYLKDAIEKGGHFDAGGKVSAEQKLIEPTIITGLNKDALLLKEEIFGPVLPVLEFDEVSKVPELILNGDKPLALYIYSKSRKNIKFILKNTRAGGTVVNHSLIHIMNPNLPFGGSNYSGIGKGMGHHGFLEFSNERGFLRQYTPFSAAELLMPPYTKFSSWLVRFTERWLS